MDSPNQIWQPAFKILYPIHTHIHVWELDAYLATGNEKSSKLFFCNLSQVAKYQDWSAISSWADNKRCISYLKQFFQWVNLLSKSDDSIQILSSSWCPQILISWYYSSTRWLPMRAPHLGSWNSPQPNAQIVQYQIIEFGTTRELHVRSKDPFSVQELHFLRLSSF